MKKILIGLLTLGSTSAFTESNCRLNVRAISPKEQGMTSNIIKKSFLSLEKCESLCQDGKALSGLIGRNKTPLFCKMIYMDKSGMRTSHKFKIPPLQPVSIYSGK